VELAGAAMHPDAMGELDGATVQLGDASELCAPVQLTLGAAGGAHARALHSPTRRRNSRRDGR